ncbi:Hypothetical predicted protein, partial [Pelobates cultripes]
TQRPTTWLLPPELAKPSSRIIITHHRSQLNQQRKQRHRGDRGNPRTNYYRLNGLIL